MKKKAYYFVIDSLIALFIFTVGIVYLLSFSVSEPPTKQSEIFSYDIIQFISTVKIDEVDHPVSGKLGSMVAERQINTTDHTIMQQMGEFVYRYKKGDCSYCLENATNFTSHLLYNITSPQFNYNLTIDGELVYTTGNAVDPPALLPQRTVVSGLLNKEEFFGPYIVEVFLWQE